jgi:hypothetical protein
LTTSNPSPDPVLIIAVGATLTCWWYQAIQTLQVLNQLGQLTSPPLGEAFYGKAMQLHNRQLEQAAWQRGALLRMPPARTPYCLTSRTSRYPRQHQAAYKSWKKGVTRVQTTSQYFSSAAMACKRRPYLLPGILAVIGRTMVKLLCF